MMEDHRSKLEICCFIKFERCKNTIVLFHLKNSKLLITQLNNLKYNIKI